ncbi:MAG: hypothetical protein WC451_01615 [Patescibacteria group bacterium]|jgi:nicotinamidase-related amidase
MKYKILAIDIQNDFATEGGKHYTHKPSVDFLKSKILPFLKEKGIKIAEIVSDYRQPRPGDADESCVPGTWGYESVVPKEFVGGQWIKCMNSPIWTRDNAGDTSKEPGLPRQDTIGFGKWLEENIGKPSEVTPVLIGLTIDCCVLSTAQELNWRGHYPVVVKEGVDHYTGKQEMKEKIFETPLPNWADAVDWEEIKNKLS